MINRIRIVGNIAVVTANAEMNPLRHLSQLSKELESLRFKGSVLLDLLSVNGLTDNRFVSVEFDGHTFDRKSFSVESVVDPLLREEQNFLMKQDPSFLKDSVLTPAELSDFLH
ncbi:type II toxin-antitoxin system RnlB family antitoxin [Cellvibrio sp. UBA7671]|uniref:type II toxin-antitoxin system RnlB family antitoxin n=1 Tax=Cellvibrio sp. UBA7671 TaxID=1946312 RepID=UPI002F355451